MAHGDVDVSLGELPNLAAYVRQIGSEEPGFTP
jgi:hypothetical protein